MKKLTILGITVCGVITWNVGVRILRNIVVKAMIAELNDPNSKYNESHNKPYGSDIIFGTRKDAEDALEQLHTFIDDYDCASVNDLKELVGIAGSFKDNKYGWKKLIGIRIVRVKYGYVMRLPKPIVLEEPDEASDDLKETDKAPTYDMSYFWSTRFENGDEAYDVLEKMKKILTTNKKVTVEDLHTILAEPTDFIDRKIGWTDLKDVKIELIKNKYIIRLPIAEKL